jgi:hypothetical protein
MTTVSVLYFSGSGHTAKMAEAAAATGAKVNLLPIRGEDINQGHYQNDALLAQPMPAMRSFLTLRSIWAGPHSSRPLPMQRASVGFSTSGRTKSPRVSPSPVAQRDKLATLVGNAALVTGSWLK